MFSITSIPLGININFNYHLNKIKEVAKMTGKKAKLFGVMAFLVILILTITACDSNGGILNTPDEFNTNIEVFDANTSAEIEGANIIIDDYNVNANTDTNGEFIVNYEEIQGTLINFEVFMGGYTDYSANFEAGDSTVTVEMQPLSIDPAFDDVEFSTNDGFNLSVNEQAGIEINMITPDDGSETRSFMSTNVNVATVTQGSNIASITAVSPGTADILVTIEAPGYNPTISTIVVTVN